MTSNQLTLGRLMEDTRHNKMTEKLGFQTLGETKRHNVKSEAIGFGNIGLGYANLGEMKRHNIATENYLGRQAAAASGKMEAETKYVRTQNEGYERELRAQEANAKAALERATNDTDRVAIERELASIRKMLSAYEARKLESESWLNSAKTVREGTEIIGNIAGLFK